MGTNYSITEQFGANLAELLAEKICKVYHEFDTVHFIQDTANKTIGQSYTQRVATLAELLNLSPSRLQESFTYPDGNLGRRKPQRNWDVYPLLLDFAHREVCAGVRHRAFRPLNESH